MHGMHNTIRNKPDFKKFAYSLRFQLLLSVPQYSIQHGADYKNPFVSVSQSVCPSVGTLVVEFLDRFSPKLADIRTPKEKRVRQGSIQHHPSHILPTKTPILGQEVLKTHVSNPISASLNVRESPKYPRLLRNRGRGTKLILSAFKLHVKCLHFPFSYAYL